MLGSMLLVLATSLDGFSAGVAYGFRKVRFPWWGRVAVAGVSVLILAAAMFLGRMVGHAFPGEWARWAGGGSLIAIGIWTAFRGLATGSRVPLPGRIWTWRVPSLGLVIQIMREPIRADLDASGSINGLEAFWLGLALSVDALGAGFCATIGAGMPLYLPLVAGLVNWIFLSAGMAAGRLVKSDGWSATAAVPGLVLVVMGLLRVV